MGILFIFRFDLVYSIITYTFSSASSSSSHSFPYREATSLPPTLSALVFSHIPREKQRTVLTLFLPPEAIVSVYNFYPLITLTPLVLFLSLSISTHVPYTWFYFLPLPVSFLSGTKKRQLESLSPFHATHSYLLLSLAFTAPPPLDTRSPNSNHKSSLSEDSKSDC